jgi:hypothetical protein
MSRAVYQVVSGTILTPYDNRRLTDTNVANLFRRIRLLLESVPSQF